RFHSRVPSTAVSHVVLIQNGLAIREPDYAVHRQFERVAYRSSQIIASAPKRRGVPTFFDALFFASRRECHPTKTRSAFSASIRSSRRRSSSVHVHVNI